MVISESAINDNSAGTHGGGIQNMADMTLVSSTVNGNAEGGIDNYGLLTVRGSMVAGNSMYFEGGGISNGGTLVLTSSTVSGNTAMLRGGGIANAGSVTLRSSVVTQNTAVLGLPDDDPSVLLFGGGIFNYPTGAVTLRRSSVSGNTPDDCVGC